MYFKNISGNPVTPRVLSCSSRIWHLGELVPTFVSDVELFGRPGFPGVLP